MINDIIEKIKIENTIISKNSIIERKVLHKVPKSERRVQHKVPKMNLVVANYHRTTEQDISSHK
jgi:hypothetical protein